MIVDNIQYYGQKLDFIQSTGVTRRIFNFANCLVGHIRGGLGHANVVASLIFAGMSRPIMYLSFTTAVFFYLTIVSEGMFKDLYDFSC